MTKEEVLLGLHTVREKNPLVHNITNYVVMNNTANALIAVGASPVMAHAVEEVEDMVNIASALVINMGTLSDTWVKAMLNAGRKANERGIPVVFDPVGVGATPYRTSSAAKIIAECKPSIIRGNASEIMGLMNTGIVTKGVDSTHSPDSALDSAKALAIETGSVIVISGKEDYITDGKQLATIGNGVELMAKVTGMGCTATAIIGAFAGAMDNAFSAAVSAMAVMGIAGELAAKKSDGPGSMQMNFLDILYNLDTADIKTGIKFTYE